jgi:alkylation response protein AidB-like acyl-CoA dehydrogenase
MSFPVADARPDARTRDRGEFRAFVDSVVAPCADEFDRAQEIPPETLRAVAAEGYFGAALPASSGGAGLDMVTLGELHDEVGRACSSLRSLLTVHTMAAATIDRWASAEARGEWLPSLASGERLAAFCLTEPEAGSDAMAGATTARRCGGDYRLDGVKRWITGGQIADVLLVFARTERGPAAFVVEATAPGVERVAIRDVLGTRASMLAEIRFDGCRVPASALIGREGGGGMLATSALDLGRYSVAAGCVGILQACLDACVDYTSRRRQGGALLREHQLVRRLISDMVTRLRAARLLCRHAGELKDEGDPSTVTATWIAKYFASTNAMRCAGDAVQLHGANGCGDGYSVNRYFRDAKVMEIIEGSTQIQQLMIADTAYQQAGDPLLATLAGSRS